MADKVDMADMTDANVGPHDGFGYKGDGIYACFCGQVLSTAGLIRTNDEGSTIGVTTLREQFQAHRAEMGL